MFKRIGILGNPRRPGSKHIAERVRERLTQHNIHTWEKIAWDEASISEPVKDSDLIIAIGGDGSMLRAARISAHCDVPVFGINAGHLGFLTEASALDWLAALDKLMEGDYWIESRMMVSAEARRGNEIIDRDDALNDVVISRGAIARAVLLDMYIDSGWTTTYNADGLVVATPTGSTAYALAAGGPILPPELKNILVVPVASHLSLERPIVLSEGSTVEVHVSPETQADVILSVDGQRTINLQLDDVVTVRASDCAAQFIRIRERNYFYRSILDRLEPRIPPRRDHAHIEEA
jgi:NAD+ kinase